MKMTPRTTTLEAVETLCGTEMEAASTRTTLGETTVHQWGTYFAEDAPQRVPREALPRDRQHALGIADIVARRLRSKARGLVERHGEANPPTWLTEEINKRTEETVEDMTDGEFLEAVENLWGEAPATASVDEVGGSDRRSSTTRPHARGPRQPERSQDGEPVSDDAIARAAQDLFN